MYTKIDATSRIYFGIHWCNNAPMNDWDNYRVLLALSRTGSLRSAAEILGVNHTTVSRKLATLSQQYKDPIFERTAGGYHATEFGEMLVDSAKEIEKINFASEIKSRAIAKDISGKVNLSVSIPIYQYLIADDIKQLCKMYPHIEITLHTSESPVNLDRSEADIVIRTAHQPPSHLVGRKLFSYYGAFYSQREYLENTKVENLSWIANPKDTHRQWLKDSPYPNTRIGIRATGYQDRFLLLLNGNGLARAACFMADAEKSLVRLPGSKPFEIIPLWILTHPDLRKSPRIKVVMKFLSEAIHKKKDLIQGKAPQVSAVLA